jgi:hypothetical protein
VPYNSFVRGICGHRDISTHSFHFVLLEIQVHCQILGSYSSEDDDSNDVLGCNVMWTCR